MPTSDSNLALVQLSRPVRYPTVEHRHTGMRFLIQKTARHGLSCTGGRRPYHASVLPSLISPGTPEFQAKFEAMSSLVQDFESKMTQARQGGGPKAAERMTSKGKKLPRERYVMYLSP